MRRRMRAFVILAAVIAMLYAGRAGAQEEKKEITVTGKLVCASCDLKLAKECAAGIDAGEEKYILTKNEESKKVFPKRYDGLTAMVTGTLEVKGKGKYAKKYITASKIEVAEPPKE
jgi:hypothetical protein